MSETELPSAPEVAPTDAPQSAASRFRFFLLWGAVALGVLVAFRSVLLPFFLAVVVSYVMAPVVAAVERRQFAGRSLPRWGAVVLVYLGLVGATGVFTAIALPRIAAEVQILAREVPRKIADVRDRYLPRVERALHDAMATYDTESPVPAPAPTVDATTRAAAPAPADGTPGRALGPQDSIRIQPDGRGGYEVRLPRDGIIVSPQGERYRITNASQADRASSDLSQAVSDALRSLSENTQQHAGTILVAARNVARAIVRGIFTFFLMLMLSAYILVTRDAILGFFRTLVHPGNRGRFDVLLDRIDRGLSGVVRGQLLICLVNGVLSGIGFYLLHLRYWPILTLIATVLSIIPIFGAILSSIPAVAIGLQTDLTTGLLTLGWILVIHQIEANLLNPKILGDAAKVHPVLVVFALLAGEHAFGIAGALLAVPVLSIGQSLFLHYRESTLGIPGPTAHTTSS